MNRRRFLLNTSTLSAALTFTNAPFLAAIDQRGSAKPGDVKPAVRKGRVALANESIAWNVEWHDGKLASTGLENKLSGKSFPLSAVEELTVTLSAADHRVEIPWWKFQFGPDTSNVPLEEERGLKLGFHRPELQDEPWQVTENLLLKRLSGPKQRYQDDIRYEGFGWFRRSIELPSTARGQELNIVLGGYDQQDWNDYWVYLNGEEVGHRSAQGRWRTPGIFKIAPGDAAYSSLRFGTGEPNLLAVRTRGFDKRFGGYSDELLRRYVFEPFWVDQFITVGAPYLRVTDFEVRTVASSATKATFELTSPSTGVDAVLHYELDGPTRRKWAEIQNRGGTERLLLDVQVDDFRSTLPASEGGPGAPIFLGQEAFTALEHPTGINQGDGNRVRLIHFPGRALPAGGSYRTRTALVSVARAGEALQHFNDYLQSRSPRKQKALSLYTPYGINNPSGACPALNDLETLNILDVVEQWKKKGIDLDYFTLDQGWLDPTSDLTGFAAQCYPEGPAKIVERVRAMGMKFGLWFSISGAPWSCAENPAMNPSFMPPPGDPDAGHHPIEMFNTGYGMLHGRLCVASEPYSSMLKNAVMRLIKENGLKLFKIDMGTYYCNSTEHGHLPGKYSVEAQYEHLLELAATGRRADPDVYVMWYWGLRSPFFALFGDSVFESGLFMEGSGTSWFPTLYYRDSVTLNLDQGTQFASTIPPINKDSLGVWLADIRWGNFMGSERWREALVMDLGRGSLIFPQLWGDIHLLDDGDVEFLSEMNGIAKGRAEMFLHRRNILGDPWKNEVYGYANSRGAEGFLFINNAHFGGRVAELRLGPELGLDAPAGTPIDIVSRFPERKLIAPPEGADFKIGDVATIWLRPFEVLMLEVGPLNDAGSSSATTLSREAARNLPVRTFSTPDEVGNWSHKLAIQHRSPVEAWADVHFVHANNFEKKGFEKKSQVWNVDLPSLENGPHILAIPILLRRDGEEWRYAPAAVEIVQVVAYVGDQRIQMIPVPDARQFGNTQNAGCSWVVYKFRLNPQWSGKKLRFAVAAYVPQEVEVVAECWVIQQWWQEPSRPQGDGFFADEP